MIITCFFFVKVKAEMILFTLAETGGSERAPILTIPAGQRIKVKNVV